MYASIPMMILAVLLAAVPGIWASLSEAAAQRRHEAGRARPRAAGPAPTPAITPTSELPKAA